MPNRVEEIARDSRGPYVALRQQRWRGVAVFGRLRGEKGGLEGREWLPLRSYRDG